MQFFKRRPTTEHILKVDKALDYSLKFQEFQELEDVAMRRAKKLEILPKKGRNIWLLTLFGSRMSC